MDMKEPTVAIPFSLRVWGKLPLSTAAAACDGIERSLRLVKNIYMSCPPNWSLYKHFQSAAHRVVPPDLLAKVAASAAMTWSELLALCCYPWECRSPMKEPESPEMAKFYIVLLCRTQETIQKLMITGPCKFQIHLSWSESLILTSRSRTNHSLCTSLSCQEDQPKRKFVSNWNWSDGQPRNLLVLPWAPMSHKVGSHRGDEVIWWYLVNKQKIYPMVCSPPHPKLWCSLYQFVLTKWSCKSRCLG